MTIRNISHRVNILRTRSAGVIDFDITLIVEIDYTAH
jgi:hypothetical protein